MGPSFRKAVTFNGGEQPGTIIIDVKRRVLVLVVSANSALRYDISVGREGFGWSGRVTVGEKRKWPDWRPPAEMLARDPSLPESVPPGPYNPLGARALYLFRGGKDTLYRIHGTNHPGGVGSDGTSGCFRLTNTDIVDLFNRVKIGTEVTVR
jgi:lipoprotein-anchoring transpeptidase ErfK/SrfK